MLHIIRKIHLVFIVVVADDKGLELILLVVSVFPTTAADQLVEEEDRETGHQVDWDVEEVED